MKIFTSKSLLKFSRTFFKNTYKLNLSREDLLRRILTHPENEEVGNDIKAISESVKNPHQLVELTHQVTKISSQLSLEGYELGYNLKKKPVRIAVTGAAGNISYSLLFRIASGELLGKDQPVILHLIEVPQALKSLEGVAMELNDCSFTLLKGIVVTDKLEVGFKDVDYAFLVGAKPRGKGMERKDLLLENAKIFQEQGRALNEHAKKTTLTLIVGNPANTNCLIAASNAPNIPEENFSAMMRLDHNRAISQLAEKKQALVTDIKNVVIWGNHSSTQVPDLSNATVNGKPALEGLDDAWEDQFISKVQQRGAEIIAARGLSSAFSAADAALKHMRDWVLGTNGEYVSMGVPSNGLYGLKNHIYCSFPVICLGNGKIKVVEDMKMNSKIKKRFKDTVKELEEEKEAVKDLLGKKN